MLSGIDLLVNICVLPGLSPFFVKQLLSLLGGYNKKHAIKLTINKKLT